MNAVCSALLAVLSLAPQETGVASAGAATTTSAVRAHVLERVAIIGASLSEGFQAPPGWGAAFEASLARPGTVVANTATSYVFFGPRDHAAPQIQEALDERPTLVLAADFLFWFGYGTADFEGGAMTTEEQRLAMLEHGLKLLEAFTCTVVVGDFPDMSPAVGRVLAPQQMPKAETLAKLNTRVAAWAKEHGNVVVLPLASWVADLQAKRAIRIGELAFEPEITARWLQRDQLHPTAEGLAALATLVHHELAARKLEQAGDYVADLAKVYERMQAASESTAGAAGGK